MEGPRYTIIDKTISENISMNNLYFLDQHKLRPEDVGRWKFVALSVSKNVGFFYQDGIKGFNQSKVCKTSTL